MKTYINLLYATWPVLNRPRDNNKIINPSSLGIGMYKRFLKDCFLKIVRLISSKKKKKKIHLVNIFYTRCVISGFSTEPGIHFIATFFLSKIMVNKIKYIS